LSSGDGSMLGETAPVGLFEADGDMIIRATNPKMAQMAGLSQQELIGRPLRTLLTRSSQFIYALKVEHALLNEGAAEEISPTAHREAETAKAHRG